ncbi:hypothetical protein [Nocardia higoensis]|uniref:hypothetical protein n=1 Tax=Nocardia higoensis TaxID=228599 RepID=UPI0002E08B53|nr:hypothetical protein [Nocardia higoensis]
MTKQFFSGGRGFGISNGILLDTNYLSKWQQGGIDRPGQDKLAVSTTALQELYGMQATTGWGYRYLLPRMSGARRAARVSSPADLERHRSRIQQGVAWKNTTDRLVVDFPVELSRYGFVTTYEKSHHALAELQTAGATDILHTVATWAVGRDIGRIVEERSEFVARAGIEPIPLTERDIDTAVALLRDFLATGNNLKRHRRNSFNDLLILATALRRGMGLATDDRLLLELALRAGLTETDEVEGFTTLAPAVRYDPPRGSGESKRYVNAAWRSRRATTFRDRS